MKVVKVYVHLLNEGTTVLRPVPSLEIGNNWYLLQETKDYDPDDEEWEFLPGAVVFCEPENHEGGEVLVARYTVSKDVDVGVRRPCEIRAFS
ncbi:MAG: hypothetical protein LGR52_13560 [Candidatus Thiosymbion ectosymbiont of Robbea hypermnestra]|nr:hypothetical protein [Candidatus Thiosymbion ectosymbiont of Robbea hypermnestra]